VDASGNVYIVDAFDNAIRKVSGGVIVTVAGNGTFGYSGDNGPATSAALNQPSGVAVDASGNIYIADTHNSAIRKISGGVISTIAGNGIYGYSGDNGPAANAQLCAPVGVAADAAGNVYIADAGCSVVRKVSNGIITTFAGNGARGYSLPNGPATSAELNLPVAVAVDASGNVYIADAGIDMNAIFEVSNGVIATFAGNGTNGYFGDNGPAASAGLFAPSGVAVDSVGNVYIAESGPINVIRKVSNGVIATIAGNGTSGYSGDGGAATSAELSGPMGMAAGAGKVYIADSANNAIRMVSGANISTVAGNGTPSYQGDGGPATSATVNNPEGVALDSANNLYIADTSNSAIRKVTVSTGIITTVAGTITSGFSGDDGPAIGAELDDPDGVAVDAAGNIYIADRFNSRIRMVLTSGIIVTVAGRTGQPALVGDGGPATSALLFFPTGVVLDGSGNVYVTDNQNDAIRKLTPVPSAPSIQPGGIITATDFGGAPATAPGSWLEIYGANLASDTRSWTKADFHGNSAPTSLDGTYVTIDGTAAFVAYISPTQVNVQVPSAITKSPAVVTVTTGVATSAPYYIPLNLTEPGLLAPPSFKVAGKQYVVALFPDGTTYVAPTGAIPGVTSKPASVGDTITLYGVGFGPVTPDVAAGQIAPSTPNTISAPIQIFFGNTAAPLEYSGLAPGIVGLYQFNVVVPNVAPGNAIPVSINLNGNVGTQTLYTAVQ